MSDQPSVFVEPVSTDTPPAEPQAPANPAAPVVPTIASEFVGEGKKYNSVEAALNSIGPAQDHIDTIEAENARLRGDLDRSTKLDDALSRIEADKEQIARPATPELNQAQVREEARNVYQQMTAKEAEAANVNSANKAIFDVYGEKAPEVTAQVAAKLGVSVDFLEATAKVSPAAFMKLITDSSSGDARMPHSEQSSVNSDAINANQIPAEPSVNVGLSGNTKDVLVGWRAAGQKVASNK